MGKIDITETNSTHSGRQPAKKLPRHAAQRSKTLMRQAVKKPPASFKRRVKAQGHTDALVEQPSADIIEKTSFGKPDPSRLQRASHIKKSQLIRHFNPDQPAYAVPVTVTKAVAEPVSLPVTGQPAATAPAPAPNPDFLELAIQNATSHLEPAPKKPRKRLLHLSRKHARA